MQTGDEVNTKELLESVVAFVRSFGLHKPDQTPCGQPVAVAEAHALMDLAAFGSMRQGELAARLQLEKSTVSRLVRQMEAHGWIQRNSDRHDGRAVLLRLTRRGEKQLLSLPGRAKRSSLEFSLQFLRISAQWSSRLFRFWKELVHNRKTSQCFSG